MKKNSAILENIKAYFREMAQTQEDCFEMKIIDNNCENFTKISVTFNDPNTNLSIIENELGFKGQFYSIPYAHIDFKLGSRDGLISEKFWRVLNALLSRVERIKSNYHSNQYLKVASDSTPDGAKDLKEI